MKPYTSSSGKQSGVLFYEIGDNFIIVKFRTGTYKYSYASCGKNIVTAMKKIASSGSGLSTFISQNNPDYESKTEE